MLKDFRNWIAGGHRGKEENGCSPAEAFVVIVIVVIDVCGHYGLRGVIGFLI